MSLKKTYLFIDGRINNCTNKVEAILQRPDGKYYLCSLQRFKQLQSEGRIKFHFTGEGEKWLKRMSQNS